MHERAANSGWVRVLDRTWWCVRRPIAVSHLRARALTRASACLHALLLQVELPAGQRVEYKYVILEEQVGSGPAGLVLPLDSNAW